MENMMDTAAVATLTPQQEFSQNLLNLATWYAVHPNAPPPNLELYFSIGNFHAKSEELKAIGEGEKEFDETFFRYKVKGDGFTLSFVEYRDQVCKRKVVGKKIVPAQVIAAKAAEVIPEHEEDIIEWECPGSMLVPREESEVA